LKRKSASDDEADEAVVEYTDETTEDSAAYSTGIVKFWINQ